MNTNPPTFLDFEASGLNKVDSYPISVAYNLFGTDLREYFINPKDFKNPDYWDISSERLHKISRKSLDSDPSANVIANFLNDDLGGKTVYAWDSKPPLHLSLSGAQYGMDKIWFNRLFEAAEVDPSFKIESTYDLMRDVLISKGYKIEEYVSNNRFETPNLLLQIRKMKEFSRNKHSARSDVKNTLLIWDYINGLEEQN